AHPRQLGTAGLERIVGAFQGLLGSLINLRLGGFVAGIIKSAVAPVTVGAEHARSLAVLALGPIEIAGNIMARIAREEDFLDRVIVAIDLAMDDRPQRS